MTTRLEIKAARHNLFPCSRRKPKPEEIDSMRAFLVKALSRGLYQPGHQPDIGSVWLDAEEHGHIASEDTVDEAICIAATLEGISLICIGRDPLSICIPAPKEREMWKRRFAEKTMELWRGEVRSNTK